MSSNFSNFDLLFNVEKGKKLTKAQFLENYERLKQQNKGKGSVFEDNMEEVIGEMFEVLNTEKSQNGEEEFLDQNEVAALRSYFDDKDGNSKISSNDINELQKRVTDNLNRQVQSIEISSPEKMYQRALQEANGDMRESSYILDLADNIETINSLILLRQQESNDKINEYERKINELIQKSSNLSGEFKADYNRKTKEAEKLRNQMQEKQAKIQANKQRMIELKQEQAVVQRQISSMSDEEKEQNPSFIKNKNSELSALQSDSAALLSENKNLSSELSACSSKLNDLNKQMSQMQKEAQKNDSSVKKEIDSYKKKIEKEKKDCENDINNYNLKLNALNAAKDYAMQQLAYEGCEPYASHQNDNALTFDQLRAQGLKYSSAKGQKLASDVYAHRVGFTGYCSRHVSDGLQRTGLGNERAGAAADMDDKLRNNPNYREVKITSREDLQKLPAGCIIVYERGAKDTKYNKSYSAKYGHIEVTVGDGTAVSDGVTRNIRYCQNMTVFVPVEPA